MRAAFAIPGDLATPTGGYAYARALIAAAPSAGLALEHLPLPGGWPFPDAAALSAAAEALAGTRGPVLADGLALGAMPQEVVRAACGPVVALCHHPLWLEAGLAPRIAERLRATEAAALALCPAVIVPSAATARDVAALGVPVERITVAAPGLARAGAAPRRGTPPMILSVGSLTPRKGHDILIAALGMLGDRAWTCTIAGPDDRNPAWAAHLHRLAQGLPGSLAGRLRFVGAVDNAGLDALYAGADLFCLPSHHEGYGMVFAEAMMRGLPVVAARAGAVPDVVPPAAGVLVPPGDAGALAEALARLLDDRTAAAEMAAAARTHALSLDDWTGTAATVAAVLRGVAE